MRQALATGPGAGTTAISRRAEDSNEQPVQDHVGDSCRHGADKPETRSAGSRQERLKDILENECGIEEQDDAGIFDAVFHHAGIRSQQPGDIRRKDTAKGTCQYTCDNSRPGHHGKVPAGQFLLAFSQGAGRQGSAPGSVHETESAQDHESRHDEIDGRKSGLPRPVGDEEPIHDAVDRAEDHHGHRGQTVSEKSSIGVMTCQSVHTRISFPASASLCRGCRRKPDCAGSLSRSSCPNRAAYSSKSATKDSAFSAPMASRTLYSVSWT